MSRDMETPATCLQNGYKRSVWQRLCRQLSTLTPGRPKLSSEYTSTDPPLPSCAVPTYLGVMLDRSHTFHRHLESLHKTIISHVALMRRLVGSGWGARARRLHTAVLALVYSTVDHCAPVRYGSAHTLLVDTPINEVLRIVTGCLRLLPRSFHPCSHPALRASPHGSHSTSPEPGHGDKPFASPMPNCHI